jgi:integrase/recombinase XerD
MPLEIEKIQLDNQNFIGVHVHFTDTKSREKIKTVAGRFWHPHEKLWLIPYDADTYQQFKDIFGNDIKIKNSATLRVVQPILTEPKLGLKPDHQDKSFPTENHALFDKLTKKQQIAVSKLENLLIEERKAYHTIKGYRNIFIQFLMSYPDTLPSQITGAQIKAYIVKRIKEDNISRSTQNHIISTFQAFYGRLLEQEEKVGNLFRPDIIRDLPKGLTPIEVQSLINQVGNLKHKCLIMLMYGSGLRVGEVVRLRPFDIDYIEKTVFVYKGKHYKDRYTILSETCIKYLKQYLAVQKPKPTLWLFESPDGGHYSERSVQLVFAEAMAKARIHKPLSTHSLRHAFATELLKASSDLDFVRKVLGHASIKTTQIYLHVLKVDLTRTRSPLDSLDI